MNSIQITGRLCAEPERRTSNSGKSVTVISVAVKRPFTKDITDFLSVVLWEKKCDYICQYGHKGDVVAVSGALTSRQWEDNGGNKRTSYEIVADTVEIVHSKQEVKQATRPASPDVQAEWEEVAGDDLPF